MLTRGLVCRLHGARTSRVFVARKVTPQLLSGEKRGARWVSGDPKAGTSWVSSHFREWSRDRTPFATWTMSDLGVSSQVIPQDEDARLLASWSIDANYRGHIPADPSLTGAPPRLELKNIGRSIQRDKLISKEAITPLKAARNTVERIFHSAVKHRSPDLDPQTIDFFSYLGTVKRNMIFGSNPVLIVASRGQPLMILNFMLPGTGRSTDTKYLGTAFEIALTQDDHNIPRPSTHQRVIGERFGHLSLALQYEVDARVTSATTTRSEETLHNAQLDGLETSSTTQSAGIGPELDAPPNPIIYINHSAAEVEPVEIKTYSPRTRATRLKDLVSSSWFTRIKKACVGVVGKDHNIRIHMVDLAQLRKKHSDRYQLRFQRLHALLLKLKAVIPRDRAGAYVLCPLDVQVDFKDRKWELYEADMDDPLVKWRFDRLNTFPEKDSQPV
ncbi:hypothetical protein CC86DRAFT_435612 [Ophiobolus disseminans]|uniref:Geranylgeranyl pyrophosphate synthetase n=1 Tax=Ophiobolus disseminans TaxID=1469910 RepID=A0A6A7A8V0_9PLEO|nr:hypothetical protein CC86DRAFT_435612 [Ophiobolus disseminans]